MGIKCGSCRVENRKSAKFCKSCGKPIDHTPEALKKAHKTISKNLENNGTDGISLLKLTMLTCLIGIFLMALGLVFHALLLQSLAMILFVVTGALYYENRNELKLDM